MSDRLGEWTYPEVGATVGQGPLPAGYRHLHRSILLGSGRSRFTRAADALLNWRMQERAGLSVDARERPVRPGAAATLRLPLGPFRLRAPCRVVCVIDEPRRKGFAYGTLPGHPERGEELFLITLESSGDVTFAITAFSRSDRWYSKLGGPVTHAVQSRFTTRYLEALRDLAEAG